MSVGSTPVSRRDLMLGGFLRAFAQQPRFSADVKVVTLLATVHDRDGAVVTGLNREDFAVEEDGVPQTIRYFSRESDLPLTIGLLVDTSRSQRSVLELERLASRTFLDQALRGDKDRAFIAHFDYRVKVLQDMTSSRPLLTSALDQLEVPRHGFTLLYQAIRECAEAQMRNRAGRKAFVVLSDGHDVFSRTSIVTAIEYAQRADTIIYSILFSGQHTLNQARGRRVMQRLASETGGASFEGSNETPIEKIYASIEEQLRNQYSIGYTPERKAAAPRYRQIRLTTKRPGLAVQTRAGYYAE